MVSPEQWNVDAFYLPFLFGKRKDNELLDIIFFAQVCGCCGEKYAPLAQDEESAKPDTSKDQVSQPETQESGKCEQRTREEEEARRSPGKTFSQQRSCVCFTTVCNLSQA